MKTVKAQWKIKVSSLKCYSKEFMKEEVECNSGKVGWIGSNFQGSSMPIHSLDFFSTGA